MFDYYVSGLFSVYSLFNVWKKVTITLSKFKMKSFQSFKVGFAGKCFYQISLTIQFAGTFIVRKDSVTLRPEGLEIIGCRPPFLKPKLHKESKNWVQTNQFPVPPVSDFFKLLFSVPKIVKKIGRYHF